MQSALGRATLKKQKNPEITDFSRQIAKNILTNMVDGNGWFIS